MRFTSVSRQTAEVSERLRAQVARVRPLVSVNDVVPIKVARVTKVHSALLAHVRPTAGVEVHVPRQVTAVREPPLADSAGVRSVPGVSPDVVHEAARHPKTLAAIVAHVGPCARVHTAVLLQLGPLRKRLRTLAADKRLAGVVCPTMSRHAAAIPENLAADVADKFRSVCFPFNFQPFGRILWRVAGKLGSGISFEVR